MIQPVQLMVVYVCFSALVERLEEQLQEVVPIPTEKLCLDAGYTKVHPIEPKNKSQTTPHNTEKNI